MKLNFLFLILLAVSMLLTACGSNGTDTVDTAEDTFAKCLTDKGLKMYGTEWCSHCKNQKALFGDSFEHVDYTDCDKDRQACTDAGVQGFPTWIYEGTSYPGTRELTELATLTGCSQ